MNIAIIDEVLTDYYKFNHSITKISKNKSITSTKIKSIIKNYGVVFLEKNPQYKKEENVSIEDYKSYIQSSNYIEPSKTIDKTINKPRVKQEESSYIDNF